MTTSVRPAAARRPKGTPPGLLRGIYLPRSMDAVAFAMTTYGIPLLVLATTGSGALTGLAFAAEWVPRLMAFALAGTLVGRYGTTRVLRCASTARALVVLAAALLLPAQSTGPGATATVMLLAASTGILTEFSYIAAETAGGLASRTAGTDAHRIQSALFGIDQTATLAGPALAGLLLNISGPAGMLTVIAAFSLLASAFTPSQHRGQRCADRAPGRQGLRTGWSTLRALPALAWLVTGLCVSNLAIGLLQAAAPVIVIKQFGHTSADVGLLWSAAAVATLGAITVCRRAIDRYGLWPVGAASAGLAALACLALSLTHTYGAYLTLTAVLMIGEGGLTVVLRTLRSHLIPAETFGTTLALTILLLLLPFPLAGLLVAAIPPVLLSHALTVCAVLQALGLATAFTRLRTAPVLRAAT
ncbi:MFS transporter [Streptomyces sp. WAC 06725]|uniref:MFS transporter n=1 Tax=Streptomyces sp. WAC 06725 TaxID=2203209 RepID=UPI000F73B281|nr:MFS transporter [Streptomyces sp. WAC 06725]RSO42010.1 MFS transporter [Streptomyces sp. WAC 06725]